MSEEDLRVFWGTPDFKVEPKHRYRMDLNKVLNRDGSRLSLLLQREKYDSEEAFLEDVRKKWSAYHLADETYPPTYILHGDADNAVPVEQSYRFEKRLKELGVEVEAVYCSGGEHCFENKIEVCPTGPSWFLACGVIHSAYMSRQKRVAGNLLAGETIRALRTTVGTATLRPAWPLWRGTSVESSDRRSKCGHCHARALRKHWLGGDNQLMMMRSNETVCVDDVHI
jgi:hypothetical protein